MALLCLQDILFQWELIPFVRLTSRFRRRAHELASTQGLQPVPHLKRKVQTIGINEDRFSLHIGIPGSPGFVHWNRQEETIASRKQFAITLN